MFPPSQHSLPHSLRRVGRSPYGKEETRSLCACLHVSVVPNPNPTPLWALVKRQNCQCHLTCLITDFTVEKTLGFTDLTIILTGLSRPLKTI